MKGVKCPVSLFDSALIIYMNAPVFLFFQSKSNYTIKEDKEHNTPLPNQYGLEDHAE